MPRRAVSHFCQKCCAANPLGQEFCRRCGTRLMIVVQPPSVRVDSIETTPHEEHLLERVTTLENALTRLAERLEQGLKLLLRHSETTYTHHALVKSLVEILSEAGVIDHPRLDVKWRSECDKLHESVADSPAPVSAQKKNSRKSKRKASTNR